MNDLTMTVTGWVATDPRHVVGPTGTRLTSFRLASTSRYFDRDKGVWADGNTEWFTVRTFRNAAITVMNSIEKGQPVLVQGRLRTHQWDAEAGPRTDLIIDAVSVGHDLTKGVATFTRATADANLVGDTPSGDTSSGDTSSGDTASGDAVGDVGGQDAEPIVAESEAEVGADALLDEVSAAA